MQVADTAARKSGIDTEISNLQNRLDQLKAERESALKSELADLESRAAEIRAELSGGAPAAPKKRRGRPAKSTTSAPKAKKKSTGRRGRPPGSKNKAKKVAKKTVKPAAKKGPKKVTKKAPKKRVAKKGPKKSTGRRQRTSSAEIRAKLEGALKAAGSKGLSAIEASKKTGIQYLTASNNLKKFAKSTGSNKNKRYFLK